VDSVRSQARFEAGFNARQAAAFSPDGQALAVLEMSVSRLGTGLPVPQVNYDLVLRDTHTGAVLREYPRSTTTLSFEIPKLSRGPDARHLRFSPDGRVLGATVFDEATGAEHIWLWDVRTGRRLTKPPKGEVPGQLFDFFPAGGLLVAVSGGTTLRCPSWSIAEVFARWDRRTKPTGVALWDLATGTRALQLPNPPREISAVAVSADGRFLAFGTNSGVIHLQDLLTEKEAARLEGHRGVVWSLAFGVDGRLASGSDDSTVLVWDAPKLLTKWRQPMRLKDWEALRLERFLLGGDSLKGSRAVWRLALAPERALPLVKKLVRPAPQPDKHIKRLVRNLGSENYRARATAEEELLALGEKAECALRGAILEGNDLEVRRRAERLLKRLDGQALRAVERRCLALLEQIGSSEARKMLIELAGGASGALLTREAKSALGRLRRPVRHGR
jgi:hypothetical protein